MDLICNNKVIADNVIIYNNFFMKFFGLRFSKPLDDEAIVFVNKKESKLNTIVDMFFVNFSLDVLWLNKDMKVVDKATLKPFQIKKPKQRAMNIIELKEGKGKNIKIGDKVEIR